ncbi:MAG: addiction module protein [Dethiobacter sp.]|nr:addiction module protein [Dethiobacter sp.]
MNSRLRNLPIDERIKLVQDLWDSISADQNKLSLTDEQKDELDRRIDAFETSHVQQVH